MEPPSSVDLSDIFSSHFSCELCGLEDWNLVHTWAVGRCIIYTGIRLLLLIRSFISSFFFLSNFQYWNFLSHFSRELLGLEDWKLVHTWTVGRYYAVYHVYQNQSAAAYSSLYFFICLCVQFSTLKFLVTLFSGSVRPRRLKIGTHVNSGQLYQVYQNQAAAAYSSLYFFIFLSLQFSTLKFFITLFSGTVRPRILKLGTHIDSGQMYTGIRLLFAYSSLYFSFFFLSSFQTLNFFVTLFSGSARHRRLKFGTLVDK